MQRVNIELGRSEWVKRKGVKALEVPSRFHVASQLNGRGKPWEAHAMIRHTGEPGAVIRFTDIDSGEFIAGRVPVLPLLDEVWQQYGVLPGTSNVITYEGEQYAPLPRWGGTHVQGVPDAKNTEVGGETTAAEGAAVAWMIRTCNMAIKTLGVKHHRLVFTPSHFCVSRNRRADCHQDLTIEPLVALLALENRMPGCIVFPEYALCLETVHLDIVVFDPRLYHGTWCEALNNDIRAVRTNFSFYNQGPPE